MGESSADPGPDPDQPARLRWAIIDALRRYGTSAAELGRVFSTQHDLQPNDLQALVAIMSAEGAGQSLTPSRLRAHLGLSSGGTSYVIDRLERAGHIVRARDHPSDSRVVHLRYTEQGMATGMAFFGPLGQRTEQVLDAFTTDELRTIARFLAAATQSMNEHVDGLRGRTADRSEPEVGSE